MMTVSMIVLYFYGNSLKLFFSSTFIEAMGLWDRTLPRQIAVAIVNILLDVFLVKIYGIAGIVFASFFATTVVALPLDIIVTCRYAFNRESGFVFNKIEKSFVMLIGVCGLSHFICGLIQCEGIGQLVWNALVCLITPNMILYLFYRSSPEFKDVTSRIKTLLLKKK